jgi:alkanesulfonate monooxygenase SsuD/methylene tetrahydromethanopterin reductase-like flavin-dependent oxidoreductase (luciferase family)
MVPEGSELVFPGDIRSYGLVGTIDTIRQRLAAYEAAGVQELVISFLDAPQVDMMQRFAKAFVL